jgi:hypothetical protein
LHANAKAIGLCFVQLFSGICARSADAKMLHLKLLHTYSTKSDTFADGTTTLRSESGRPRHLASGVQGAPVAVFQVAPVGANA